MLLLLWRLSVRGTQSETRPTQKEREEGVGKMTKTNNYARKLAMALAAMLAALVLASGAALAVNKVCPSGSTQANPCSGTSGIDLLIGTSGSDYIKGLAGNDKISGGAGDDTTDGGGGSDTYSYREGWGTDTLIDSGGSADHLNFSAVGSSGPGVAANLHPELGSNTVFGPNGAIVNVSSGTVIEKVTGSSYYDNIRTGGAANTLRPGPGTGGASLSDFGGAPYNSTTIPASSDTYSGFSASGYGRVTIQDGGGTADKLVLPFASDDVHFEASSVDNDAAADNLLIMSNPTDYVYIYGQLEPYFNAKGHIEQIQFTDETIAIGGESPQAQALGDARSAGGAEAQIAALNDASSLDAAEKGRLSKAANKATEEPKNNDNLLSGSGRER
jgi:Ca2+-binding RTX toxin-like protein